MLELGTTDVVHELGSSDGCIDTEGLDELGAIDGLELTVGAQELEGC